MNAASIVESLGWTLLHFLWQGAAVTAICGAGLHLAREASANFRYLIGCYALATMVALSAITFSEQLEKIGRPELNPVMLDSSRTATAPADIPGQAGQPASATSKVLPVMGPGQSSPSAAAIPIRMPAAAGNPARPDPRKLIRPWLPLIVGLWAIGVGLLSLRFGTDWLAVRRLRRSAVELNDFSTTRRFKELHARLRVARPVQLLSSTIAVVPLAAGWLRPIVLIPAELIATMPAGQLDAVIAHELAHIRRHDYLVNLIQNLIETLFFFHPGVWWVSAQISKEREHCCDDMASAVSGSAIEYAKALTALEESLSATIPTTALAAVGRHGNLFERVCRLLGVAPSGSARLNWPAGALMFLAVFAAILIPAAMKATDATPSKTGERTDSIENEEIPLAAPDHQAGNDGDSPERNTEPEALPGGDSPEKPNEQPKTDQSSLELARKTMERFLEAPSWRERLPYIYAGGILRDRIRAFYQSHPDEAITGYQLKYLLQDEEPHDGDYPLYVFFLKIDGGDGEYPITVRELSSGMKVDWESFVEFHHREFGRFLESGATGPKQFRVILERQSYWGQDRKKMPNLLSYLVETPDPEVSCMAFVPANSALSTQMEKYFSWGAGPIATAIELERKVMPHGESHYIINRLVTDPEASDGWHVKPVMMRQLESDYRTPIIITKENEILFQGRKIPIEKLPETLKAFKAANPKSKVEYEADRDARIELLVRVWEAAKKAGIEFETPALRILHDGEVKSSWSGSGLFPRNQP